MFYIFSIVYEKMNFIQNIYKNHPVLTYTIYKIIVPVLNVTELIEKEKKTK